MWRSALQYISKRLVPVLLGYEISTIIESDNNKIVQYVAPAPTVAPTVATTVEPEFVVIVILLSIILIAAAAALYKLFVYRRPSDDVVQLRDL